MSNITWESVSKAIGQEKRKITYPSMEVVNQAFKDKNISEMLLWFRFLESPVNKIQLEILDKIGEYLWTLKNEVCQ